VLIISSSWGFQLGGHLHAIKQLAQIAGGAHARGQTYFVVKQSRLRNARHERRAGIDLLCFYFTWFIRASNVWCCDGDWAGPLGNSLARALNPARSLDRSTRHAGLAPPRAESLRGGAWMPPSITTRMPGCGARQARACTGIDSLRDGASSIFPYFFSTDSDRIWKTAWTLAGSDLKVIATFGLWQREELDWSELKADGENPSKNHQNLPIWKLLEE
jgi:hypothetical protein